MTDRLTGLLLLAFAVWFGVLGWNLPRSFFSDPTGSRAFPLGVAALLAPLALALILRPSRTAVAWAPRGTWPLLGVMLLTLVAYALVLEPLGFLLATVLAFTALALVFRAPPTRAVVASVVATVTLYALFGWVLELYLPDGALVERWLR